ncbi:2-oxoglutarate and iron-dependent oxygenase domain-containing protein 3-like [Schistocerca nitens]|uniref:2-oxoglutarate and iron-dependent oxygenase domain-containing protein 3-like n=1 Tax=Schistocerca nitens TaxID=7011 RepID=UPI002118AA3C|nr:2-oxoglutarate and iron-dependent oxygenase domain-containing protein 3-like [Schistocerca nitens]
MTLAKPRGELRQVRKKEDAKNKPKATSPKPDNKEEQTKDKPPKYGPMPKFPKQRLWARGILMVGVMAVVYFTSKNSREICIAKQKDVLQHQAQDIACSNEIKAELMKYPGCAPARCGRLVSDKLVSATEAEMLLSLAQRGIGLGGSDGGASILDLHSGALSHGRTFTNIYMLEKAKNLFKKPDFAIYKIVKLKIQQAVAYHFGLDYTAIHLTHPTFFSRLTDAPPKTVHDEYWHPHVDKETYESFHYTSLLYLSDYGKDFTGGRFVFVDKEFNKTVEPRKGRVLMFTSGSENVHYVEPVTSGTRFAITVSFTCDKKFAISDPNMNNFSRRR